MSLRGSFAGLRRSRLLHRQSRKSCAARGNLLLSVDPVLIVRMRKLHISLGIALLLLTAQLGAVLHEVSHICRVGTNVEAQAHADTFLEKTCELCLAFSQVTNPAGNTVAVGQFEPSSCSAGSLVAGAATPADVPTPRSRGPPSSALPILIRFG
jgi:hypothetical protein